MFPGNKWSCDKKRKPYIDFDLILPSIRYSSIFDIKNGPIELSQSKNNLISRYWICYQDSINVYLRGAIDENTWSEPILIFEEVNEIEEISLTFDSLGREIIFYKISSGLYVWFFDSLASSFIKLLISENGKNPLADFDYINNTSNENADAMIFYVKNDGIYWRLQRDRFTIEYFSYEEKEDIKLLKGGNTTTNQFQLLYGYPNFKDRRELPKVYETESYVFTSLNNDNLEFGFTLGFGEYKECVFKKGITTFGLIQQSDYTNQFGNNLLIRCTYNSDHPYPQLIILGRDVGVDLATLYMNEHFRRGDYKFVFTNVSPSVKSVEFYFNDVLIDSATFNKVGEEPVTSNTSLRFASIDQHIGSTRSYWRSFPAQFFNMYAIVNGSRIDWPVTEGVQGATSVPAGNDLILIKPTKEFNDIG